MAKKIHGGKRKKSGRKPIAEGLKKIQVTLYIQQSEIDKFGGIDTLKERIYHFVQIS